jgi:hypothetical protein
LSLPFNAITSFQRLSVSISGVIVADRHLRLSQTADAEMQGQTAAGLDSAQRDDYALLENVATRDDLAIL